MRAIALIAIMISACASAGPPVAPQSQFNEAEYAPFKVDGTATISGQAFLKTQGGEVRHAAGNLIFLLPSTAYTRDWVNLQVNNSATEWKKKIAEMDQRIAPYVRRVIGDSEGRFVFENVPAGNYIVYSDIHWRAGYGITGGPAFASIQVTDGQRLTGVVATQ